MSYIKKSLRINNVGSLAIFRASWYLNPGNRIDIALFWYVFKCLRVVLGLTCVPWGILYNSMCAYKDN